MNIKKPDIKELDLLWELVLANGYSANTAMAAHFIASLKRLEEQDVYGYIPKDRAFMAQWYREYYLHSHHWDEVREWALHLAKYSCQLDSSHRMNLNVHHTNYGCLWHERPEDLKVLCRACHEKFHNKDKAKVQTEAEKTHAAGDAA